MTDRHDVADLMGHEMLKDLLEEALQTGPDAIALQVRYILGMAQLSDLSSDSTPLQEPVTTTAEARIGALVAFKHVLDQKNIKGILRNSHQIQHDELRIAVLLEVATELEPNTRTQLIEDLWQQIQRLKDPKVRARLLYRLIPLFSTELEEKTQIAQPLLNTIRLARAMENPEARVRSVVALVVHLPISMQIEVFHRLLDDADASSNDTMRANTIVTIAERLPSFIEQRIIQSVGRIKTPYERVRALTALARTASQQIQSTIRREAMRAIVQIENEDERAETLIRFAPYLEAADEEDGYSELLAQALGVAVTLSRRTMRARVLVALAPHLTLDLQGEALAAVHSLSNERERALMLGDLVPTLPPNMLVASLAVAHTMRENDARVAALTSLSQYVPDHARAQTVQDALAAANSLSHSYERITALMGLVDVLPPHILDEAFANALKATSEIDKESARARALSQLGQFLPTNRMAEALRLAAEIQDPQMKVNALVGLAARIDEEQRDELLRQVIDAVQEMQIEYKQARALVSCAPHLTPEMILSSVEIADQFADPFDKVSSYIALAQNLPSDIRPTVVQKAWTLINAIDDGYDRSSTLASIAPYMPDDEDRELARRAEAVLNAIVDEYDRASAISLLAGLLARGEMSESENELNRFAVVGEAFTAALAISQQSARNLHLELGAHIWQTLDNDERYRLWSLIAPQLAAMPLADVLLCLATLFPLIATFTSIESHKNIAHILGLR